MAIVTFYNGDPKDAPKTTMPAHLGANAIITCKGRLLLEKRSEVTPHAVQAFEIPNYPAHTVGQLPALAARFANAAQCPAEAAEKLQYLIFPITEAESIPEAWRAGSRGGNRGGRCRGSCSADSSKRPPRGWTPCRTRVLPGRWSTTPHSCAIPTAGRCTAAWA